MRGRVHLGILSALLGLANPCSASSFVGHMVQITQIGTRTYIYFNDGKFEGPPSACPYPKNGMIYSVDNTKPEGHALLAKILAHGRDLGKAVGDGNCSPNTMYRDAHGEGLILYLPR